MKDGKPGDSSDPVNLTLCSADRFIQNASVLQTDTYLTRGTTHDSVLSNRQQPFELYLEQGSTTFNVRISLSGTSV
jgi:hypothetical protein